MSTSIVFLGRMTALAVALLLLLMVAGSTAVMLVAVLCSLLAGAGLLHRDKSLPLRKRATGVLAVSAVLVAGANLDTASAARAANEAAHSGSGTKKPIPHPTRAVRVLTTAYCITGRTAAGGWTRWGTVAATLPFGTRIHIPGYGKGVVLDRGGAVGAGHLDLYMPSCNQAIGWGRRMLMVRVEV